MRRSNIKKINLDKINSEKVYVIFNKPYDILTQFTSEDKKDLSLFNLPKNIYSVGRLDKDSEGLLFLTNDGKFADQFIRKHERIYWAQVDHEVSLEKLDILKRGIKFKDYTSLPCKAKVLLSEDFTLLNERPVPIRFRKNIPTSFIELILKEGKNRQVRKMTAHIGHPTLRLYRVGLGKLFLNKNIFLKPGEWIYISKDQL